MPSLVMSTGCTVRHLLVSAGRRSRSSSPPISAELPERCQLDGVGSCTPCSSTVGCCAGAGSGTPSSPEPSAPPSDSSDARNRPDPTAGAEKLSIAEEGACGCAAYAEGRHRQRVSNRLSPRMNVTMPLRLINIHPSAIGVGRCDRM